MSRREKSWWSLDSRWITTQLQQAEAGLSEARKAETAALAALEATRAHATQAGATYERSRKLLEGEATTRESFEGAQAAYKSAGAGCLSGPGHAGGLPIPCQAGPGRGGWGHGSIKKDTVILSPYDGKVTAKMAAEGGDMAAPAGAPLLCPWKKTGAHSLPSGAGGCHPSPNFISGTFIWINRSR